MENSRLVQLVQSLDKKEIIAFRRFLQSPYFNKREDVQHLFEMIVKKNGQLSKEEAGAKLFPRQGYDPQQVRFVMSWLSKRLEAFLIVQETLADEVKAKLHLTSILRKRKLLHQFKISQREGQKLVDGSSKQTGEHYWQCYQLLQEQNLVAANQQRTAELKLQEESNYFDAFYLIEKLKQACLIQSHQAVYKSSYDIGVLQDLLVRLDEEYLKKWPAINAYFQCYQMLVSDKGQAHYKVLKEMLVEQEELFPVNELRDLYLFAINFSIKQLNSGVSVFRQEAFELYQLCLDKSLLRLDGYLSRFAYRNIVALGLDLKAFDWVENFLHEYQSLLSPKHRQAIYSFNLAKWAYAKQDFDTAILQLQEADYKDILLNLAAKTLLLKIYYIKGESRSLDSHLSAMQRFVSRKKILAYHRNNYANIIYCFRQLTQLNPYDNKAHSQLEEEIKALSPLSEKNWFLEQLSNTRP